MSYPQSGTALPSSVASTTAAQLLIPANPDRFGVSITNNSTALLYIMCGPQGANVSATVLTAILAASGGYWESPFNFYGEIHGVWASANGVANVTEYKP